MWLLLLKLVSSNNDEDKVRINTIQWEPLSLLFCCIKQPATNCALPCSKCKDLVPLSECGARWMGLNIEASLAPGNGQISSACLVGAGNNNED